MFLFTGNFVSRFILPTRFAIVTAVLITGVSVPLACMQAKQETAIDAGEGTSDDKTLEQALRAIETIHVGMTEEAVMKLMRPHALDQGSLYIGDPGEHILCFELAEKKQVSFWIPGSNDPENSDTVVQIGDVVAKVPWIRHGDRIKFEYFPDNFDLVAENSRMSVAQQGAAKKGNLEQALRAIETIHVGMTEEAVLELMRPHALDQGTFYLGGSGARVLYFQIASDKQVSFSIGGGYDLKNFSYVVDVGPIELKVPWIRHRGDSITPGDISTTTPAPWGNTAKEFVCRVVRWRTTPEEGEYSTRLHVDVVVKNLADTERSFDFVVPSSGEPAISFYRQEEGKWIDTGNAFSSLPDEASPVQIASGKVGKATYAVGLVDEEVAQLKTGMPMRVAVGFGTGPHDETPLYSGPFVVFPKEDDDALENPLVDAAKAKAVPVVLRVRLIEQGEGSKYLWPKVKVLDVFKNETEREFVGELRVAHYSFGAGLPDGESTIYIVPYGPANPEAKDLWRLDEVASPAETVPGFSHHVPTDKAAVTDEIKQALDRLNDWDKEEMDVHERPERYPNRKPSGETNGWIHTHKDKLAELGVSVRWNADKKQYEIVEQAAEKKAAKPMPVVLHLDKVFAEKNPTTIIEGDTERETFNLSIRCDVRLINKSSDKLVVKSNFYSAFDGLWLVVTDDQGIELHREYYLAHQSPYSIEPRKFEVPVGTLSKTLSFPIRAPDWIDKKIRVHLEGGLPGTQYETGLRSNTLSLGKVPDYEPLKLSIALPQQVWREGERLRIKAVLHNGGKEAISVNTGQPSLGFQATVVDAQGKEYGMLITRVQGSFRQTLKQDWRLIEPTESIELMLEPKNLHDWDSPQSHTWPSPIPGSFRLTVNYSHFDSTYWDRAQEKAIEVENAWEGKKIKSNEVTFQVKPREDKGAKRRALPPKAAEQPLPEAERLEVQRLVEEDLPEGWAVDVIQGELVLRRLDEPIIVNVVSGPGPRDGETHEAYRRRHQVSLNYRIRLRMAPKLTGREVADRVEQNRNVEEEMATIRDTDFFRQSKGIPTAAETKEQQHQLDRYKVLQESIKEIPDAHYQDVSIYIRSTSLGFAEFLSEETQRECERVKERVLANFSTYNTEDLPD